MAKIRFKKQSFTLERVQEAKDLLDKLYSRVTQLNQLFFTDWSALAENRQESPGKGIGMFFDSLRANRHDAAVCQRDFSIKMSRLLEWFKEHPEHDKINGFLPSTFCLYDPDEDWSSAAKFLSTGEPLAIRALRDSMERHHGHFFDWLSATQKSSPGGLVDLNNYAPDKSIFDVQGLVKKFVFEDIAFSQQGRPYFLRETLDVMAQGLRGVPIVAPKYTIVYPK